LEKIIEWLLYLIVAILGWLLKTLWNAVQSLKKSVHDLEVELPKNYVTKLELTQMLDTVMRKLDKIETLFITHINEAFKDRTK
jgi:hypothetical protein